MLGNIGIVINFVLIYGILVFFHELGHFAVAKYFKMWVHEFALGMFQPKFSLFRIKETEYSIRAIPLGGFVRIAGMHVDDGSELPEDVIQEDAAVPVKDRFNNRPIYQRYLVILAGPLASLLLGYIGLVIQTTMVGVGTGNTTTQIHAVSVDMPAAKAGIQPGEKIITLDGIAVANGKMVVDKLQASAGKPLHFEIADTKGVTRDVTITPKAVEQEGKTIGRVGIEMEMERRPVSFPEALKYGVLNVGVWFEMIGQIFARGEAKSALGGPLRIIGAVKEVRSQGIDAQFSLLGQLSLSLALFNLLPIPMLDGGHLTLLTLEAIRRRKLTSQQTVQTSIAGMVVLGLLFVYIMYNDIARFFTGKG
jgi:regulator of sigma E protease